MIITMLINSGECARLEFNSNEFELFQKLFLNHSELFRTNPENVSNFVGCEHDKNNLTKSTSQQFYPRLLTK